MKSVRGLHIYVKMTNTTPAAPSAPSDRPAPPAPSAAKLPKTGKTAATKRLKRLVKTVLVSNERTVKAFRQGTKNMIELIEGMQAREEHRVAKQKERWAKEVAVAKLRAAIPYQARGMARTMQDLMHDQPPRGLSDDATNQWRKARDELDNLYRATLVAKINRKRTNVDITEDQEALGLARWATDDVGQVNADSEYDSQDDSDSTVSTSGQEWHTSEESDSSASDDSSDSTSSVDEDARMAAKHKNKEARGKVYDNKRTVKTVYRYKPSMVTDQEQRADKNAFAPRRH